MSLTPDSQQGICSGELKPRLLSRLFIVTQNVPLASKLPQPKPLPKQLVLVCQVCLGTELCKGCSDRVPDHVQRLCHHSRFTPDRATCLILRYRRSCAFVADGKSFRDLGRQPLAKVRTRVWIPQHPCKCWLGVVATCSSSLSGRASPERLASSVPLPAYLLSLCVSLHF